MQVLNTLLDKYNLSDATDVILSGCSAGALGVFFHADYFYQRILEFKDVVRTDGKSACKIIFDSNLYKVVNIPHRPFQGWRYLETKDIPKDDILYDPKNFDSSNEQLISESSPVIKRRDFDERKLNSCRSKPEETSQPRKKRIRKMIEKTVQQK